MRHHALLVGSFFAVSLWASPSKGAGLSGGPYRIDPVDVNGGGGRAASAAYSLVGSVAQTGGVDGGGDDACELSGGFWASVAGSKHIVDSTPEDQESLWRFQKNVIRLIFDGDVVAPQGGEISIQEMLADGNYGPDLSSEFAFAVENDGYGAPRVLRIQENGSALTHRTWYAVRGDGSWSDVRGFIVRYVVQVGDADADGQVLRKDVGVIRGGVPNFQADDDERRDIDGDGRILRRDLGAARARVPSLPVPKPSGH